MDLMTVYLLNTLVIAALIGLIPATIAYRKGRSFFAWWLFGGALFIVALPAAILLRPDIAELERRQLEQGTVKRCPYCKELVKSEARVCKHCGRDLTVSPQPNDEPNLGDHKTEGERQHDERRRQPGHRGPDDAGVAGVGVPKMVEIERLLGLGRLDLEAGYPQYAREYFEKVLVLDATNREAIDGLARVNEILSRKEAAAVKPTQDESVESSAQVERKRSIREKKIEGQRRSLAQSFKRRPMRITLILLIFVASIFASRDVLTAWLLPSLVIAVFLGLIPAVIADQKGRDFFDWWVFGWLLFIVALPTALLLKPNIAELETRQLEQGTVKRCRYCAELVKREARVCKHCGRDVTVPP